MMPHDDRRIQKYIIECEGEQEDNNFEVWDDLIINYHLDNEIDDNIIDDQLITDYGVISRLKTITFLNNQSAQHAFARLDSSILSSDTNNNVISNISSTDFTNKDFIISPEVTSTSNPISFDSIPSSTAITSFPKLISIHDTPSFPLSNVSRYSDSIFEGIMIDTDAAKVSKGGQDQFYALSKTLNLNLENKTVGQAKICFGIGTATSIDSTTVRTPIGEIVFHILPSDTPFLLCLRDMDRLNFRFDNLRNILVQDNKPVPIV